MILAYYFVHVTYLSQTAITLPFELYPTHIRNIGLDSLVGILCIFIPVMHNRVTKERQEVHGKVKDTMGGINLSLNELIHPNKVPWRRPRQHPLQSAVLILFLFSMYVASGLLAPAIITFLNIVAVFVPLTVPMQR